MVSGNFQIYDTPGAGLALAPPDYAANLTVNSAILGRTFTGGTNRDRQPGQCQSPRAQYDFR